MTRYPVTDTTARRPDGTRYVLGHASTPEGARRVLSRWLRKSVRKAKRVGLGSPAVEQWVSCA